MSFLDVKLLQGQCKFDWDAINVGNNQLDHSQKFFAKKHYEHERLDEMELLQQEMVKTEISDCDGSMKLCDKENLAYKCSSSSENESVKSKKINTPSGVLDEIKKIPAPPVDVKKNMVKAGEDPCQGATNIAYEWSIKEPPHSKVSKGAILKMPPPPQAYLVKDVYKKKREEAERRRLEEEKKLREFHSRPAPDFSYHHEQFQKRKPPHVFSVSVTPQVLKKSREAEEKRRKRLEEWKKKNQPPKFKSKPPSVLSEKPFAPEKRPTVIQQCPFNLHMEKRLQERKHYDEIIQKALEEKQKQVEIEEEERKRVEEERIRELRKATLFKARPNPFKN